MALDVMLLVSMKMAIVVVNKVCLQVSWQQVLNSIRDGELVMKRLVATIMLSIALLTSGAVVTQSSLVGTAYAEAAGGSE
jgi:hypothetical protein